MDATEFVQWIDAHKRLHPDFAVWSSSLPPKSRKDLSTAFRSTLAQTPLEAALDISNGMVDGRYEYPKEWRYGRGFQLTARHVAEVARATKATPLYRRQPDAGRPDSYRCSDCRDSGTIDVFSARSVQRVAESPELRALLGSLKDEPPQELPSLPIDGDTRPASSMRRMLDEVLRGIRAVAYRPTDAVLAARRLRTMCALCHCSAGGEFLRRQEGLTDKDRHWHDGQRYDPERHCSCIGGDTLRNAVKLVEWVEWKMSAEAARNYTDEFASWNNQGRR